MNTTNSVTNSAQINSNFDEKSFAGESLTQLTNQQREKIAEDDFDQFIKEEKIKELKEIHEKIERERDSRLAAEKRKKEIDKANVAREKQQRAIVRKKEKREK
jgi:hypothetical protein